jgi:hypothetical protein
MSKGVDVYTFLTDGRTISASVDGTGKTFTQSYQYGNPWQAQVNSWYSGEITWVAGAANNEVAQSSAFVSGVTGNCDGPMEHMLATSSVVSSNGAVSYGFYDAGSGTANLTNRDQLYVYFSGSFQSWMTGLAASVSGFGDQPFNTWALPGSHDAGMFDRSMLTSAFLLLGPEAFFSTAAGSYGILIVLPIVGPLLAANPGEIVVVDVNNQGFQDSENMTPAPEVLAGYLSTAQQNSAYKGVIGSEADLGRSYNQLVSTNTRLILVQDGDKYDSYNEPGYSTTSPSTIVAQLAAMSSGGQAGKQFTVLQMQATSTNLDDVVRASAFTLSDASSPLMATKASIDAATNPWLQQNVNQKFVNDQLVVFLNDFVDNCMVSSAINVSRREAAKPDAGDCPPGGGGGPSRAWLSPGSYAGREGALLDRSAPQGGQGYGLWERRAHR